MQGKTARIWLAFGGERDNSRPKEQILWTKSDQKTWHVATNEFT